MNKTFTRLCEWQSNQPPILFLFTLPLFIFLIATCVIRFFVVTMPFWTVALLLGYYQCDVCKKWFHIWKHGKSISDFFNRNTMCQTCGEEYWDDFNDSLLRQHKLEQDK